MVGGMAAMGAVVTAMLVTAGCESGKYAESECSDSVGSLAAQGARNGALWGVGFAAVGLAIGDKWETSPLPGLGLAVVPQRSGIGMSLSLSF